MIRNILIIFIILASIFAVLTVQIYKETHKTDEKSACQTFYDSFDGSGFQLPHPPFDCTPYPPDHPLY